MHVRMVEMERILRFGPPLSNAIPVTLPLSSMTGPPVPPCIKEMLLTKLCDEVRIQYWEIIMLLVP
jgi:hypothetical protein